MCPVSYMFGSLLKHSSDTSTSRQPRWKLQIVVKLSSPAFCLCDWKHSPGYPTMANVTIASIINHNMISNAFLLPKHSWLCMYVTDVGRGLKYSGVQALHYHKDSGRGQSLLTAQTLSMMTPVCFIWKVFALLPLPVMVSSSVLDSSVVFVLHVQDRLMWEHCPLLIHFCTEASTRQADWHETCGTGSLKCYGSLTALTILTWLALLRCRTRVSERAADVRPDSPQQSSWRNHME